MNSTHAMLVIALAVSPFQGCAEDGKSPGAGAVAVGPQAGERFVTVGNPDGSVRLSFSEAGMILRAFDDVLLGLPLSSSDSGKSPVPLWVDNRPLESHLPQQFKLLERCSSNGWQFVSVDLKDSFGPSIAEYRRSMLHVEPNLTVVCDEIIPREPAPIQTGCWFPVRPTHDLVRGEWHCQSNSAGALVRFLTSPKGGVETVELSGADSGPALLRVGGTNKVVCYRQLTVLLSGKDQRIPSVAFKLLESDSAIGVRVHRDGLPTLIAFRKSSFTGNSDLTGLKFSGPVAVDVFRPKRK